jgi:ABC-type uncharacterized transport system substrate-binding protein
VALHSLRVSGHKTVVLLTSTKLSIYDSVAKNIASQLDATVYLAPNVSEANRPALVKSIADKHPDLLVTLGPFATTLAHEDLAQVPLIFAMVVNYRGHGLNGPHVMGISLETPPVAEFSQFMLVLPKLKHVLVFYSSLSTELLDQAREELKSLDITLDAVSVQGQADINAAFSSHAAQADAVWLMSDATVMTPETFSFLNRESLQNHKPFVASLSEEFAERGALMSVSVDFTSIAGQVAGIAQRYFSEGRALGVEPPIGAKLVVNLDTAKSDGVAIPNDVMPFIGKVVSAGH